MFCFITNLRNIPENQFIGSSHNCSPKPFPGSSLWYANSNQCQPIQEHESEFKTTAQFPIEGVYGKEFFSTYVEGELTKTSNTNNDFLVDTDEELFQRHRRVSSPNTYSITSTEMERSRSSLSEKSMSSDRSYSETPGSLSPSCSIPSLPSTSSVLSVSSKSFDLISDIDIARNLRIEDTDVTLDKENARNFLIMQLEKERYGVYDDIYKKSYVNVNSLKKYPSETDTNITDNSCSSTHKSSDYRRGSSVQENIKNYNVGRRHSSFDPAPIRRRFVRHNSQQNTINENKSMTLERSDNLQKKFSSNLNIDFPTTRQIPPEPLQHINNKFYLPSEEQEQSDSVGDIQRTESISDVNIKRSMAETRHSDSNSDETITSFDNIRRNDSNDSLTYNKKIPQFNSNNGSRFSRPENHAPDVERTSSKYRRASENHASDVESTASKYRRPSLSNLLDDDESNLDATRNSEPAEVNANVPWKNHFSNLRRKSEAAYTSPTYRKRFGSVGSTTPTVRQN